MRRLLSIFALLFVSNLSGHTLAQSSPPHLAPANFSYAPPEAFHRHSSTAAEGWLRGQAVRRQAEGNFRVLDAQAEILRQQVESLNYDNHLKKTAAAITRKQLLADYRQYERNQKQARRELARQRQRQQDFENVQDYRLTNFEFNWTTGAIYWPTFVASPRYAAHRYELERLMHDVVHVGGLNEELFESRAAILAEKFRDRLRSDFEVDPERNLRSVREAYLDTQRFLLGLKFAPAFIANQANRALAMNR
jgi:hypothetical protein